MATADNGVYLQNFSRFNDPAQGRFSALGSDGMTPDDDDHDDADGQSADPTRQRPKFSSVESLPSDGSSVRNMFFQDGDRKIDFVLAWKVKVKKQQEAEEARMIFETNLRDEGLELEYDKRNGETHFMKVHAPYKVLERYADILKIRMPMKETVVLHNMAGKFEDLESPVQSVSTRLWNSVTGFFKRFLSPFQIDPTVMPPVRRRYTCPYSRNKKYLFEMNENKELLFSNAVRSWIVDYILRRKAFKKDEGKAFSFGLKKMMADGFYDAAFPMHEGHWKPGSANNPRKLLYDYWAGWRSFLKFQPHDYIRNYFGEKIAIYFAWLGFYTTMLVPASIVGLIVFIYGCVIMYTNDVTAELCDPKNNFTMCPLCDRQCPYWKLHEACTHAAVSRIFDNGATVFFAIFMSLWGTLFLEFWKRREATIQYKWDLTNFVSEEEPPRPEYLSQLEGWHTLKVNPVTGIKEPHLPFWRRRFPIFLCSYTVMIVLALMAVGAVIGVIAYRVSMLAALQLIRKQEIFTNSSDVTTKTVNLIYQNASLLTTVTAALINLVIILLLNFVYGYLAFWLTDWECLRTQSEYDSSITLKLFALQFVNYFSSIIYIAFFKGRFVGRPGKYRTVFGGRQEECEAGGCLIELCIQLAIIMIGKQLIQNNFVEIVLPKIIKFIKKKCAKETREQKLAKTPWEKDYKMTASQTTVLFYEYLEMALQFGFLTIFCAAFPLAPIFCLLNNIIEIRCDAAKFITQLRRPVADRAANIGIWYSVLYGLSRIAIITNAFVISLTSDFIPRLVYGLRYSEDGSLKGYVNYTLAYFNTSDFEEDHRPSDSIISNEAICRYKDFRNPPWHYDREYRRSEVFWHILAAQLAFVVVFENVVVVVTSLVAWMIPDVPSELKEQIRREAYVTNEIVLKTELMRAHGQEITASTIALVSDEESGRYSPRLSEDFEEPKLIHRGVNNGVESEDSKTYV
ncbi:anoctamin-1-like isoform X3 [Haliotis rufescens]|uniref:anoctamin-1-like isoform X3 n=1 Tax=Haliotis rufescens TaxID=6454 RepID=UPI001EB0ADC2|nr:anoctamin-1-like isoform X3 [Haliotis rufescens]